MQTFRLSKPARHLHGHLRLDGSKSLSNRALIIEALAGASCGLEGLSTAADTRRLRELLAQTGPHYDAGDAGTAFRFLAAWLALRPGPHTLTGSARMQQRPVGALVEALRALGADVRYLGAEGYPPLRIDGSGFLGKNTRSIRVPGGVSSQFFSALLLIGACLPEGLELRCEGTLVSRPYLEMTLRMMNWFGARAEWSGGAVIVQPGRYQPRPLRIEADWSAASYWYAAAAFADTAELRLDGLFSESWQGDSVLAEMMQVFGIQTVFHTGAEPGVTLRKGKGPPVAGLKHFEWNFLETPDLAQTLAVVCAGLGVPARLSGLETLKIKEADRVAALRTELAKLGIAFEPEAAGSSTWLLSGAPPRWSERLRFSTYGDHRMAMAFAPLAMFAPVEIEDPAVVGKSYPAFWKDLARVGFQVENCNNDP